MSGNVVERYELKRVNDLLKMNMERRGVGRAQNRRSANYLSDLDLIDLSLEEALSEMAGNLKENDSIEIICSSQDDPKDPVIGVLINYMKSRQITLTITYEP